MEWRRGKRAKRRHSRIITTVERRGAEKERGGVEKRGERLEGNSQTIAFQKMGKKKKAFCCWVFARIFFKGKKTVKETA